MSPSATLVSPVSPGAGGQAHGVDLADLGTLQRLLEPGPELLQGVKGHQVTFLERLGTRGHCREWGLGTLSGWFGDTEDAVRRV